MNVFLMKSALSGDNIIGYYIKISKYKNFSNDYLKIYNVYVYYNYEYKQVKKIVKNFCNLKYSLMNYKHDIFNKSTREMREFVNYRILNRNEEFNFYEVKWSFVKGYEIMEE